MAHYHVFETGNASEPINSAVTFYTRRSANDTIRKRADVLRETHGMRLTGSATSKDGYTKKDKRGLVLGTLRVVECQRTSRDCAAILRRMTNGEKPSNITLCAAYPYGLTFVFAGDEGTAPAATATIPTPHGPMTVPAPAASASVPPPVSGTKPADGISPLWNMIATACANTSRSLLWGKPGTGKTTLAHHTALQTGQDNYNVTLTEESSAAELRGHYVPGADGTFVWMDGPALLAWRHGAQLTVNELDHASADVATLLHAVLDDPEIAALTLPDGTTRRPAPGFRVIATMNGNPDDLPSALRDRFPVCIEVTEAHPNAINALPADLRNAARGTITSSDPDRRVSIRLWMEFGKLRDKIGAEMAASACFGKRAKEILDALKIAR